MALELDDMIWKVSRNMTDANGYMYAMVLVYAGILGLEVVILAGNSAMNGDTSTSMQLWQ